MSAPHAPSNDRHDEDFDPAATYFELTAGKDVAKLGMRYVKTEIVHVVEGGWAAANKIEIDDEIWQVGGKDFVAMTEDERLKSLTAPKPITIKFKRPKIKDTYYQIDCHDIRLGMRYVRNTITEVKEGGWAIKNDVQVGDQLIQLNERLFEQLTEDQVLKILAGPRPLKLQFKRPAKEHTDNIAIKESQKIAGGNSLENKNNQGSDEKVEYNNDNGVVTIKKANGTNGTSPVKEKDIVVEEERSEGSGGLMGFLCCQAPQKSKKK